jgi:hypothetical protein
VKTLEAGTRELERIVASTEARATESLAAKDAGAKAVIKTLKMTMLSNEERASKKLKEKVGRERAEKLEAKEIARKYAEAAKAERAKADRAKDAENAAKAEAKTANRKTHNDKKLKGDLRFKLKEKISDLKEERSNTRDLLMDAKLILRTEESGKPYTYELERHVRGLMATGSTAPAAREQFKMDAAFSCLRSSSQALNFRTQGGLKDSGSRWAWGVGCTPTSNWPRPTLFASSGSTKRESTGCQQ